MHARASDGNGGGEIAHAVLDAGRHTTALLVTALVVAGLIAGVVAAVAFAWSGGAADPNLTRFRVAAGSVPEAGGEPLLVEEGEFWLVHLLPGEGRHAGFGLLGPGGLLALDWTSPHLGGMVPWRAEMLWEGEVGWFRGVYGSTFTKAGVRVFGPSFYGLSTFAVEVRGDGSVEVRTGDPERGGRDNPLRAVPYP